MKRKNPGAKHQVKYSLQYVPMCLHVLRASLEGLTRNPHSGASREENQWLRTKVRRDGNNVSFKLC